MTVEGRDRPVLEGGDVLTLQGNDQGALDAQEVLTGTYIIIRCST